MVAAKCRLRGENRKDAAIQSLQLPLLSAVLN